MAKRTLNDETLEDIKNGKLKIVSRIDYLFNYWTPIVAIVIGIIWISNIDGRLFSSNQIKYDTEKYMAKAEKKLSYEALDSRYVQLKDLKSLIKVIDGLTKQLKDISDKFTNYQIEHK